MRNNHEIDYKIYGEELQFVEVELDPGETVIGEPGGFMMMDDGIQMQTIFGDGSQQHNSGLLGKLLSAGKRVLIGESLFMTAFTNAGMGKKRVSFASPYPGKIIPVRLPDVGGEVLAQKDAFLCAAKGVSLGIGSEDRIGVVGVNGSGKTTLLRLIAGQLQPDYGRIIFATGVSVGYLPQNPPFDPDQTVLDAVFAASDARMKLLLAYERACHELATDDQAGGRHERLMNRVSELAHELEACYSAIEKMAASGDPAVTNLVQVELFENLTGDNQTLAEIENRLGPKSRAIYNRWRQPP